jgi:hypothetical protein
VFIAIVFILDVIDIIDVIDVIDVILARNGCAGDGFCAIDRIEHKNLAEAGMDDGNVC